MLHNKRVLHRETMEGGGASHIVTAHLDIASAVQQCGGGPPASFLLCASSLWGCDVHIVLCYYEHRLPAATTHTRWVEHSLPSSSTSLLKPSQSSCPPAWLLPERHPAFLSLVFPAADGVVVRAWKCKASQGFPRGGYPRI
jgi:hypothetical protein